MEFNYNNKLPEINSVLFAPNQASTNEEMELDLLTEYLMDDDENSMQEWTTCRNDFQDDPSLQIVSDEDELDPPRKVFSMGKNKKEEQQDKRRERNRVLAKKTRQRKKFFFESLKKQVDALTKENDHLKSIIRTQLNEEIPAGSIDLPPIFRNENDSKTSCLDKSDYCLIQTIQAAQRSFVITDPGLPDNPIIFASQGFLDLTGYTLDFILGRNCRFLQGPKTDPLDVEALRNGILSGKDTSVCILNYRADGTEFYNQIFLAALRDSNNNIINYVGVQVEIKPKKTRDDLAYGSISISGQSSDISTITTQSASTLSSNQIK